MSIPNTRDPEWGTMFGPFAIIRTIGGKHLLVDEGDEGAPLAEFVNEKEAHDFGVWVNRLEAKTLDHQAREAIAEHQAGLTQPVEGLWEAGDVEGLLKEADMLTTPLLGAYTIDRVDLVRRLAQALRESRRASADFLARIEQSDRHSDEYAEQVRSLTKRLSELEAWGRSVEAPKQNETLIAALNDGAEALEVEASTWLAVEEPDALAAAEQNDKHASILRDLADRYSRPSLIEQEAETPNA